VDISVPTPQTWNPNVAIDQVGRATAVWLRAGVVEVARRNSQGQWSTPIAVSMAGTTNNYWPGVAVDRAGNPTIVWQNYVSMASRIIAVQLSSPRARLSTPAEDAGPPKVAASPDGSLVVVGWEDNAMLEVRAVTRSAGVPGWSAPVTVGSAGLWDQPVLLDAASGGFARAVWVGRGPIVDQTLMQVSSYGPSFCLGGPAECRLGERD
jgi:hypothetical protein